MVVKGVCMTICYTSVPSRGDPERALKIAAVGLRERAPIGA